MNVYILKGHSCYSTDIIGVYATQDSAKRVATSYGTSYDSYTINEVEVIN